MPPWIGPGRTIATSTVRSYMVRGRSRGSMFIWARLSTWNTPMASPLHSMSYTALSFWGTVASSNFFSLPLGALAWIRSKALRMQVSMPSASTSTFMMARVSRSSLSHSMK
jgi:hypothetical protein